MRFEGAAGTTALGSKATVGTLPRWARHDAEAVILVMRLLAFG